MKKICIIAPNTLPVPAIKGGAVETLVNNLIDENEKNALFKFTVVTIKNLEAMRESKKYSNTKFKFINVFYNEKFEKVKSKFTKKTIFHRIIRKLLRFNEYIYSKKVYKYIKKEEYDHVIVEGGNPYNYKQILKTVGKEKCIYHLHGSIEGDNFYEEYFNYFIAISKFVKEKFVENKVIDPCKVYVINNGIKLEKFTKELTDEQKKSERKKLGLKENSVVIEFCGRTIAEKGILELIQAFQNMKNINRCELLIVGNSQFGNNVLTEYDKELEKEAKEIQSKIKFTGFIHNSELYKIYGISDISAIPSIWEEPSGLVVMEAMASGLPIVTTNSGGIPELINDKCAFMVERDEQITKNLTTMLDNLVENKQVRERMGREGKKIATKYGTEEYFNNFKSFIETI